MDPHSRNGLLAGGLWLVDFTKYIDRFPEPSRLATISQVARSNGGGAFNLLIDLARLQAGFPLAGIGLIGDDADGQWIRDRARHHGVDTQGLRVLPGGATAFTDVMTESGSGRRTFFYFPGANAELGAEHFDFSTTGARIFHLAYPGLLPRLDAPGAGGGADSGIEGLLAGATRAGLLTSVDLVSADSGHWGTLARALPQIDVLFANEWEAARLLGAPPPEETAVTSAHLVRMAEALLSRGVRRAVVLHAPRGAVCVPAGGPAAVRGSVSLPPADLRGTCGAGDALAAGFLLAFHRGATWTNCLELGICAAATCLHDLTSSEGIRPWGECLAYGRAHGFAKF